MSGGRALAALRDAPATLPCAVALALAAWWAFPDGGFQVRQWAAGGLATLGVLVVAVVAVPAGLRGVPRLVLLAAAGLAAYAAWSFASIAWATDPGFALEGATRTLLYALTFCLFALWPQRGATGVTLLGAWVAVIGVVGVALAVELTQDAELAGLLKTDRLRAPTGYPNASAALLMMPVLPAVVLAAAARIPWWARGMCGAVAVLLAGLALLTVSRGAVLGTGVTIVLLFAAVPGRVRHLFALAVVAVAVGACVSPLLDVGDAIQAGGGAVAIDAAVRSIALASLVAGLLFAVAAWWEQRRPPGAVAATRLRNTGRVVALAVLAAGLVGLVVTVGNPVTRAESAWTSFKGGYERNDAEANRLVGGLGSARYDFYRVGLRAFAENPVTGVGADGFYQDYLRAGRSEETPRYPHSVEVRALAQTGLVGAVLLFGALGCALVAAMRAMRTGGRLRRTAAQGATLAFLYWLVHGSVDWLWEWGGLSFAAFAMLGLACALARPPGSPPAGSVGGERARSRPGVAVAPALGVMLAAVALAVPFCALWLADDQQRRAVAVYAGDPLSAYALLDRAAELEPFGARPETIAGSIALRYGDLTRADAAFARALERVPDDQYATLQRGAIASALGQREQAERLLVRASQLAPRDELAREALRIVRRGGTLDVDELTLRILEAADELTA